MMIHNDYSTDLFIVAVKVQDSDIAAVKQVDNGLAFVSGSLKNVKVKVNNKSDLDYITFTMKYPVVLIYEIIGIAFDKDDNGTYETMLDKNTIKNLKTVGPH